jgi:hypothetical protein
VVYNEELRKLYASPHIIRVIKSRRISWEGHVGRMEALTDAYRISVGKPEAKRPRGRHRRMREDKTRMVKSSLCLTSHHAIKTCLL